jgi:hypothetical protein
VRRRLASRLCVRSGRYPERSAYPRHNMWRARDLFQDPGHPVEPPKTKICGITKCVCCRRRTGCERPGWSPPGFAPSPWGRPECADDRACGGDRRRRSDGADAGG